MLILTLIEKRLKMMIKISIFPLHILSFLMFELDFLNQSLGASTYEYVLIDDSTYFPLSMNVISFLSFVRDTITDK